MCDLVRTTQITWVMKYFTSIIGVLLLSAVSTSSIFADNSACNESEGVSLQVLGSGGPIADDGRASSGYLLWVNGRSRFLIDSGGGTFLRFGEAGARFEDLSHIAISHFHTDHSSDLVALLKSGFFSERSKSLSISGPASGGSYPGLDQYLESMLGEDNGAYAYLAGYLDGSAGLVKLETTTINSSNKLTSTVYSNSDSGFEVLAIGVPHGPVPTLAYRVTVGKQSIVFSGDQNGSSEAFVEFAHGADVLVMHMPVPLRFICVGRNLHAPPSVIAEIATKSATKKLVLSHFMARSLSNLDENLNIIRTGYTGLLELSNDLDCISF